jgi:hypothetical protein
MVTMHTWATVTSSNSAAAITEVCACASVSGGTFAPLLSPRQHVISEMASASHAPKSALEDNRGPTSRPPVPCPPPSSLHSNQPRSPFSLRNTGLQEVSEDPYSLTASPTALPTKARPAGVLKGGGGSNQSVFTFIVRRLVLLNPRLFRHITRFQRQASSQGYHRAPRP